MRFTPKALVLGVSIALLSGTPFLAAAHGHKGGDTSFQRIATFPVYLNTDITTETVAEIVAVSTDGNKLIYTDSANEALGFVDITDPENPQPLGTVELSGEPTSVAVVDGYAIVAINTFNDDPVFDTSGAVSVARGGELAAVNISTGIIEKTWTLPGQPDSVAVGEKPRNPRKTRYAAIAIEAEREEDGVCDLPLTPGFSPLGEDDCEEADGFVGPLPQAPAGSLVILDIQGDVNNWDTRTVDLTGLSGIEFPEDPEPEYVAINDRNQAVVTLQENNGVVIVDLRRGKVFKAFTAGTVDLDQIDLADNDQIEFVQWEAEIPREPDGVTWINRRQFATADEGDYVGGGRGFTVYNFNGRVAFTAGNTVEHAVARAGHYPEGRSDNKGNEPENVAFGIYGGKRYLVVGSERSSVLLVYRLPKKFVRNNKKAKPELVQILPAGVAPEGLLPIPSRNLLVAASEDDDRGDKFRSSLNIYRYQTGAPSYPTVESVDRSDGTPIPWAALSALAVHPEDDNVLYSVYDSFFDRSRIFEMDRTGFPTMITGEIELRDTNGAVAAVQSATEDNPIFEIFDPVTETGNIEGFVDLVNDDESVNLDPEGIAMREDGGFWVASEGSGAVGDTGRHFSPNLIVGVKPNGDIDKAIMLPGPLAAEEQRRFGFEGVTAVKEDDDEVLYVAFQREWTDAGDPAGHVRIGRYGDNEWTFVHYPLDPKESPNGGWVGLSEIVSLGENEFAVIERDNQGGPDARIKRVYSFSIGGVEFKPASDVGSFDIVTKTLVRDLVPDLQKPNGATIEKVEGMAVLSDGTLVFNTDNDGVDDSNGETQQIEVPDVF